MSHHPVVRGFEELVLKDSAKAALLRIARRCRRRGGRSYNERAVIRALRLGVGTHLAVRALEALRQLMTSIEERYQAPVHAGLAERDVADRMLTDGFNPQCPKLAFVWVKPPWRVV